MIISFDTIEQTIAYSPDVQALVKALTGENIPRGLPLAILDKGCPFKRYFRHTKNTIECDKNGLPLQGHESTESVWIESKDPRPLIVGDGKKRYTLSWQDIEAYRPRESVETREACCKSEKRAVKPVEREIVSRLSTLSDDKLAALAKLLGL